MIDPASFKHARLQAGFVIASIEVTHQPLVDALGREAIAQMRIVGKQLHLLIRAGLSQQELSITLYHGILEAASVASLHPPDRVMDFNEAAFERAAQSAHAAWSDATPENLNRMLQSCGFREE
jgi:hypothetical protein